MTAVFANAMRSAGQLIRARKLGEATRVIQNALSSGAPQMSAPAEKSEIKSATRRITNGGVIDLTADVVGSREDTKPVRKDAKSAWQNAHQEGQPESWTFPKPNLPTISLDALAMRKARKAPSVPDGAEFLSRSFTCTAGSRSYKLYIPSYDDPATRPLLVMLHGGTQDPDDFAIGTRMNALAEEHGFIVAYPHQPSAANPSLCWNWFDPKDQIRGAGEPAIIAGITQEIIANCNIDRQRVFVAGLSAGGAMAAVMSATYPDVYAAAGIHSGLPYGSATDVVSAFAAMRGDPAKTERKSHGRAGTKSHRRLRTIVFHGDADRIVHPSNAAKVTQAEKQQGDTEEHREGSFSGRTYRRSVIRDKTDRAIVEQWLIRGTGHAWSGGNADGTYTDPQGPDASREMLRFFLEEHPGRS